MGIWDYISSTSSSVIQNTPDLTTVKGWGSSSYGYGCAAVAKVDDVVRMKVIQFTQDEEARSKIGRIATNSAKTATFLAFEEGLKTIPVEEGDLNLGFPHKGDQEMPLNYKVFGRKSIRWSVIL
ncbi:hypothetical protein CMV_013208 [Castanea mollissima]|uniref:Uncharacterized protein n=1 Tax=Castanea mollissima TaxID=60419 RepID=A0A8J4QZU9_9ROSI|nr:hypothetical protein CMV_013208 [Castanea mollissima]